MIVETYILLLNIVILVDLFSNFRAHIWKLCVCVSLPLRASIAVLLENDIVCVPKPWKVIQMWMSKQHLYNHSKSLIYVTETTNAQEMVPSMHLENVSACSSFNIGIAIPLLTAVKASINFFPVYLKDWLFMLNLNWILSRA